MYLVTVDIVLDRSLIRDVLKAVIHTILFHRLFNLVRPVSPPQEVLDVTFPSVQDSALDALIAEKLSRLTALLDATAAQFSIPAPSFASLGLGSHTNVKHAQIVVSFYEKVTRKAWFSKSEEEICWEKWTINVSCITECDDVERARLTRAAEKQLQTILLQVIEFVNDNKGHIPAIRTAEENPFPYQITLPPETEESWGTVLRKILVE
ncbi:autophagy-related protein [Limtongia smithiae]|uniref:autophagy-related protein n=1 Tax=Limtongia smithiae TaxID=1125753 RepID=UPI0034CF75B9